MIIAGYLLNVCIILFVFHATTVDSLNHEREKTVPAPVKLVLKNSTPSRVALWWIPPANSKNSDPIPITTKDWIQPGNQIILNAYPGHQFYVEEIVNERTGACAIPYLICRNTTFVARNVIFSWQGQLQQPQMKLSEEFHVFYEDEDIMDPLSFSGNPYDLVHFCYSRINLNKHHSHTSDTDNSGFDNLDETDSLSLEQCVQLGLAGVLTILENEASFQQLQRESMSDRLESYACFDPSLETSPDVYETEWRSSNNIDDEKGGKIYKVHVKMERPSVSIHLLRGFIDPEECSALEDLAFQKNFVRAPIIQNGIVQVSEERRSLQAELTMVDKGIDFENSTSINIASRYRRRSFDYVSQFFGFPFLLAGQEPMKYLLYEGRGRNHTEPDHFGKHCDADCTGLPQRMGMRIATLFSYCNIPILGGHTHFANAFVHINPRKGDALFFSYLDPRTDERDTGLSMHSGCPVFEGDKKLISQWFRLGVDDENPYNSFNSMGVKYSAVE